MKKNKNIFVFLYSLLMASVSWSIIEGVLGTKPYSINLWNNIMMSFAIFWHIGIIGVGFFIKELLEKEKKWIN